MEESMNKTEIPEFIDNVNNYLRSTAATGLLLHTSEQLSPYSDFDYYLVFANAREGREFVRQGKEHASNVGKVMPARLVVNCTTANGVFSLFMSQDEVVKIDINTETMRTVQRSSGILSSGVIFDNTGRLSDYLGDEKQGLLKRYFYTPPTELQAILEQYYCFNWNALSKISKEEYRLVAFELIPIYLRMIARLENACNDRANTNFFDSNNMRPETKNRLDEIEIRPQRGTLISTLEKLQSLFRDLGIEVADRYQLFYPEEVEELFVEQLRVLRG